MGELVSEGRREGGRICWVDWWVGELVSGWVGG